MLDAESDGMKGKDWRDSGSKSRTEEHRGTAEGSLTLIEELMR